MGKKVSLVILAFLATIMISAACTPAPAELSASPTATQTQAHQETPPQALTATSALGNEGGPSPSVTPTTEPGPSPSPFPSPTDRATSPASAFHIVTPDEGLPPGKIRDIWIAPQGTVWVATENGIYVHDFETWSEVYAGAAEKLAGADESGRVWAILEGGTAIAAYEPSGNWTVYGPSEGWLALPPPGYLNPGFGDGFVTGPLGRLWLATGGDDLRRFDPVNNSWRIFQATELGFSPPEEPDYQGHFLADVELSLNRKIWVGDCIGMGETLLGQGIRWSDGESWFDAPFTSEDCVLDIEIDPAGRMWVGGFDALMTYDPSNGQWVRIPLPFWERTQLISDLTVDADSIPWVEIMRYGGASAFGEIARYHLIEGEWIEDFKGNFSSLALGENGVAWLCGGGDVFRLEDGERVALGRVASHICEIAVDGMGHVWIAGAENLWWFKP